MPESPCATGPRLAGAVPPEFPGRLHPAAKPSEDESHLQRKSGTDPTSRLQQAAENYLTSLTHLNTSCEFSSPGKARVGATIPGILAGGSPGSTFAQSPERRRGAKVEDNSADPGHPSGTKRRDLGSRCSARSSNGPLLESGNFDGYGSGE
eukprot:g6549.t1